MLAEARRVVDTWYMAADPDSPTTITEAQDAFVAAWGQMAGAWGISRTMAEVHALLYITGAALNTDEIMDRLEISRGNASMSIRALLDWGIVSRTHKRGDRKEYFTADQDVWSMFRAIVRARMKREVEPLLAVLFEIRDQLPAADDAEGDLQRDLMDHQRRLDEMLAFFKMVEKLSQRFAGPAGSGLEAAAKLLGRLS